MPRAHIVEEDFVVRSIRAFEIGALVDAIERGPDDAGVASGFDLLQRVALGLGECRPASQPVECRHHLGLEVPGSTKPCRAGDQCVKTAFLR